MTAFASEPLAREECLRLLDTVRVGRVVYTDAALPACTPVNFAMDADAVVLRTSRDSRLAAATDDAVVAFEVDEIDADSHCGWSVLVTGPAARVRDDDTVARLEGLGLTTWVPRGRDTWIRIPVAMVSGRRLVPAAANA